MMASIQKGLGQKKRTDLQTLYNLAERKTQLPVVNGVGIGKNLKGHPVTNAISCLPVSSKVNEAFKFANVKLVGNRLFQLVVNLLASHISLACLEASFLHTHKKKKFQFAAAK